MGSALSALVGGLISAGVVHVLTQRREVAIRSLQYRLDKYAAFLAAFAALGGEQRDSYEVKLRFAETFNTVILLASVPVLESLYQLYDYIQHTTTLDEQNRIVAALLVEIRRELGSDDVPTTMPLKLVSPGDALQKTLGAT
jgi:hypothetical protein